MTDSKNTPATEDKDAATAPAAPFMSVLKGNPSDAETATLALLFAGMAAAGGAPEDRGPRNNWVGWKRVSTSRTSTYRARSATSISTSTATAYRVVVTAR